MPAELSDMAAECVRLPAETEAAPVIRYRISAADTTPQSWVLERITDAGSHPEQLILFDTRAEAQEVLDGFALRKAP